MRKIDPRRFSIRREPSTGAIAALNLMNAISVCSAQITEVLTQKALLREQARRSNEIRSDSDLDVDCDILVTDLSRQCSQPKSLS